ncbi:MAG TPA: hypothetical protein VF493_21435 [Terriglobales bacterium]
MKSLILAVLLLVSSLSFAQDFSRYELSGGISYGGIDTSDLKTPRGFAGSFATNMNRWFSMETSVGAQFLTQSVVLSGTTTSLNTGFYSFLSGPRLSYRRGRVTPFAHGLVGWARSLDYTKTTYNATNLTFTVPYGNQLGAAAGGGMDYWITPRIALRTQGDYFLTQPDGTLGFHMTNNFRIVGGIVFTFGSTSTRTASMKHHARPTRRQTNEDALVKEPPQTAAPAVVITSAAPPSSPTAPGATMGAIQSSMIVGKQTSTPAAAPAPVVTITPKQDPFTPPAKPATSVANTTPAPAASTTTAVVRPQVPAKPAISVANTTPAPAPATATAVVRPPVPSKPGSPVASTTPAPAPATAAAVVRPPAPAPPASSVATATPTPAPAGSTAVIRLPAPARATTPTSQPDEQFSLGDYARKLREKKASQSKDWN